MLTMTEVQVELLCTRTVKRTPSMRPTTGLDSRELELKTSPAFSKEEKLHVTRKM